MSADQISILGTGMVARTIAASLVSAGYSITLGTNDIQKKKESNDQDAFGNPPFKDWWKGYDAVELKTFAEAAEEAAIMFNCTAGLASLSVLENIGRDSLKDKILIDVANPLDFSKGMPATLNPVNNDSLGEQIQRTFPDLRVVKALNNVTSAVMTNPTAVPGMHHVMICGNDQAAKTEAQQVLRLMGWKSEQFLDLGDISGARTMEMMVPLVMRLWGVLGTPQFNISVHT